MTVKLVWWLGLATAFGLSACGGSGVQLETIETEYNSPDLGTQFETLRTQADQLSLRSGNSLPNKGEARFVGALRFTLANGQVYLGEIDLSTNLSNLEVSGAVSDFVNQDGTPVTGVIQLWSGRIDPSVDETKTYMLITNVEGVLRDADVPIVIDGLLGGHFIGTDNPMIAGALRVTATYDGTEVNVINSSFYAGCAEPSETCAEALSFAEQSLNLAQLEAFETQFAALDQTVRAAPVFDAATFPRTGAATYEGIVDFNLLTTPDIVGSFGLLVDFGNGQVSGEVTDLVTSEAHVLEGSLAVTPSFFGGPDSGVYYGGDVTGTLQDANSTYVVSTSVEGGLVGEDENYVWAFTSDGEITINGIGHNIRSGAWRGAKTE